MAHSELGCLRSVIYYIYYFIYLYLIIFIIFLCVWLQSHKTKTLNPSWNESFHFLVQEPKTQFMRLQVYDWDGIHLKVVTHCHSGSESVSYPALSPPPLSLPSSQCLPPLDLFSQDLPISI